MEFEEVNLELPIVSDILPLVFQTLLCFFPHWKSSSPMAWNIFSHHVSFWMASALSSRGEACRRPWFLLAVSRLVLYSTTRDVPTSINKSLQKDPSFPIIEPTFVIFTDDLPKILQLDKPEHWSRCKSFHCQKLRTSFWVQYFFHWRLVLQTQGSSASWYDHKKQIL